MRLLEPFQLPEKIVKDKETNTDTYGKFEIGPLEKGFGITLGNTLRRVLLSSIQGAAIQFIKVEGIHHEFAPIPGTNKDLIDVIMQLKKITFNKTALGYKKLILETSGKGTITAADIKDSEDCKIVNSEIELFTVNEDVDVYIELWVGTGRGYIPATDHTFKESDDETENLKKLVGLIPIDSIFSPIKKVSYHTANTRVGRSVDFDKIEIEIWTDGSIDPEDSLYLSSKILKDFYNKLVKFEEEPQYIEKIELDPELERLEKILKLDVSALEMTVRSKHCLEAGKVESIHELVSKTENEMLRYRNFGKKSLEEIRKKLDEYNLNFGMDVDKIFKEIEAAKERKIIEE